jgi:hypothetical protein
MNKSKRIWLVAALTLLTGTAAMAEEGQIDASDPTKIYSYAGGGLKTTEFSNGDSLNEVRGVGNIGFGDSDMVMFELGYGNYSGSVGKGED